MRHSMGRGFRLTAALSLTAALEPDRSPGGGRGDLVRGVDTLAGDCEPCTGRRGRREGAAGVPRLLGPERRSRLLVHAPGLPGQLLPAWDLNGQVCVLPDGRFVGGYDPTLPAQHNLGGPKPYKQPADGEELDRPNGSFSGQTLYVPGPYKMHGQSVGSDSPPTANGVFNNNQTYTGCAVDSRRNVFGDDIATAQGDFPRAKQWAVGRVVRPELQDLLHRVRTDRRRRRAPPRGRHRRARAARHDGHRVQRRPARPQRRYPAACSASPASSLPYQRSTVPGRDLPARQGARVDASSRDCPSPPASPRTRRATASPSAATSAIRPSVWVSATGSPEPGRGSVPGTTVADLGKSPDQYNPFGMAFAPDGTLYFVDIHIACTGPLTGCGPASYGGRVMRVTFTNGQPSAPATVASGFDFPTSVTVCVPAQTGARTRPAGSWPRCRDRPRTPLPPADPLRAPTRPPASADLPTVQLGAGRGRRVRSRRPRRVAGRVLGSLALAVVSAGLGPAGPSGAPVRATSTVATADGIGPWDWPSYGHDAQHTFHGRTTLTEASVRTLARRGSSRPVTRSQPRRPSSTARSTSARGTTPSTPSTWRRASCGGSSRCTRRTPFRRTLDSTPGTSPPTAGW